MLRHLCFPMIVLLLTASAAVADATIDARAQRMIDSAATGRVDWSEENSFKLAHCVVQAKFATGQDDEARQIIQRAIQRRPLVEYYDPEFPLWSTMDCYMRWKDLSGKYTPELKEKTKAYVAAAKIPSTATTYNHYWMLAAGLILAYQEWGDAISYKFTSDDPTGKEWALQQLENIVRQGHGEELSPTYARYTLGPILSLCNFCSDPELKQRATLTLDAMLIRRACFFFKGHTAGMIQRSYGQFHKANNDGGFMWLYVGGPENLGGASSIGFALSDYRPPEVVAEIAADREQTYEQTSSVMRNGITEWLTTYFDRTYAIGSAYPRRNYLGKRSTWFQERLTWAIVWEDAPERVSTVFLKHPTPKYGFDKNRYLGDSPFHQVLQNEGALIGLFAIPKDCPKFYMEHSWRRQILGGFPMKPLAIIDESEQGRLFLDYGSVMIGLAMSRPFTIEDDRRRGVHYFTIDADADTFQVSYAVETANPGEYRGAPKQRLGAFHQSASVRFGEMKLGSQGGHPSLEYENMEGVCMELEWRPIGKESIRRIDGIQFIPTNREQWPLMRNPWIEQQLMGDTMRVVTDRCEMQYDFDKWTVLNGRQGE